jgi:hypothetical protein
MVNLYVVAAYTGVVIAACGAAMAGLGLLSILGYAVLGAYIGMSALALMAYMIRS